MNFIHSQEALSRRAFLRRAMNLTATGVALPTALSLAAIGEAAAFTATDYKALVCVFLNGGNDHYNTVIGYDNPSYNAYAAIRAAGAVDQSASGIALARAALANTLLVPTTPLGNNLQYALHPEMTGLAGLFNSGKAAVQLNVGPLIEPLSRSDYFAAIRSKQRPVKLFSHNDQQSTWQSFGPEGTSVGWGGKLGDLALNSNGGNSLFTCISATNNAVFLEGDNALAYQISGSGAIKVAAPAAATGPLATAVPNALKKLFALVPTHAMQQDYNAVISRSITAENTINAALNSGSAATNDAAYAPFAPILSGNGLASQLRIVARMIAARSSLGLKRQVFFVSLGGFDHHDFLITKQADLLKLVSSAMTAFYETTVNLGIANNVTAFTASDFGRTLSSNGDGSDHGWGSHHFVAGGAVKGKTFYGYAPPLGVNADPLSIQASDQWQVGQGRLLPTTSVDQMTATLGSWFGASSAELTDVVPNLNNFNATNAGITYQKNLGYFA